MSKNQSLNNYVIKGEKGGRHAWWMNRTVYYIKQYYVPTTEYHNKCVIKNHFKKNPSCFIDKWQHIIL